MKPNRLAVWLPVGFSAALSAIALTVYVASGLSDAWMPGFLGFLPMAFWFAALTDKQAREQIKALEARIQQLEAGKAPA